MITINPQTKTILSNIVALFTLQGLQYLIPLILLPYLVHTLGIEYFGLLAFATATIAFFRSTVSYGFDYTGTKQVALGKDNKKELTDILSSILFVRFMLVLSTFFILILMILTIDKVSIASTLFFYTFLVVIGDSLFPTWFFQGIEKMKFITIFRTVQRTIALILILLLVKTQEDYLLVPLIEGVLAIFAGLGSLIYIHYKFKVPIKVPKKIKVIFQLQNSWHLFLSQITVHFYTSMNIFILGLVSTNTVVGYYALAYKLYFVIQELLSPFTKAIFPFLSKKYLENKVAYYQLIKKISLWYLLALAVISSITYAFSYEIVSLISGKPIEESSSLLKIFAISLLFSIGPLYSLLLIIKSENKKLSIITFRCMILNSILLYPSIHYFGITGLSYHFLIVQIYHAYLQVKFNKEVWSKV
jgi:PST family polysaccharide transporter